MRLVYLTVPGPYIERNDVTENQARLSKPLAFFWLLRLNRTMMVAMITGATAFAANAGVTNALWMTLAGWCLAVGGFSLDFYADRDLDTKGPRAEMRHNPLTDGSLSPSIGLAFSIIFIVSGFVVTLLVAPLALLPGGLILAIIVGLALHLLERPLIRALTLGLLQALYAIMGGVSGRLSPGCGF